MPKGSSTAAGYTTQQQQGKQRLQEEGRDAQQGPANYSGTGAAAGKPMGAGGDSGAMTGGRGAVQQGAAMGVVPGKGAQAGIQGTGFAAGQGQHLGTLLGAPTKAGLSQAQMMQAQQVGAQQAAGQQVADRSFSGAPYYGNPPPGAIAAAQPAQPAQPGPGGKPRGDAYVPPPGTEVPVTVRDTGLGGVAQGPQVIPPGSGKPRGDEYVTGPGTAGPVTQKDAGLGTLLNTQGPGLGPDGSQVSVVGQGGQGGPGSYGAATGGVQRYGVDPNAGSAGVQKGAGGTSTDQRTIGEVGKTMLDVVTGQDQGATARGAGVEKNDRLVQAQSDPFAVFAGPESQAAVPSDNPYNAPDLSRGPTTEFGKGAGMAGRTAGDIIKGTAGALGEVLGGTTQAMNERDKAALEQYFGEQSGAYRDMYGQMRDLMDPAQQAAAEQAARDQLYTSVGAERDAQMRQLLGRGSRGGAISAGAEQGIGGQALRSMAEGERGLTQDAFGRKLAATQAGYQGAMGSQQALQDLLQSGFTSNKELAAMLLNYFDPKDIADMFLPG